MKTKMVREWEQLKRKSVALDKKMSSEDPAVAKTAGAQLKEIAKELRAWAKEYKVKLTRHVETHPVEARRRTQCEPYFLADIPGKKHKQRCLLIGQRRRNCFYDCVSIESL